MPAPRDLYSLFTRHASARPDRILISHAESVTSRQLLGEAERWSGRLHDVGVGPGAIVLLAGLEETAFMAALLATWARDAAAIPADPLTAAPELERIRRDLGATHHVSQEGVARLEPSLPASSMARGAAVIKLTSGSTGSPRGIAVTAGQLLADAGHLIEAMGITSEDTNIAAIPLSYSYGFGNLVMPLVMQGSPILLVPSLAPEPLAAALSIDRPAIFPGVPLLFDVLGMSPLAPRGLRLCICAGAPLSPRTAASFLERTGIPVRAFYGTSETGGITWDGSADGLAALAEEGCVGAPLPGVEVSLEGEERRVVVRGAAVASGYTAAEEAGFVDGAFMTSDTGSLDDRGRLTLTGRLSSSVNIAGRKVSPAEVERCLNSLDGVRAAAVIGMTDETRGESLGACVVADGALQRADLLAHLHASLAPWKVPRRIIFLDEIPSTSRGKVDTAALRRRLAAETSST